MTFQGRLYYLDNLRVAAMLLGVVVHTCTVADFGWIDGARTASSMFRMPLFFMLSGVFSALIYSKMAASEFVKRRILLFAVPLLTCLVVLNPITFWLVAYNSDRELALADFGTILQERLLPSIDEAAQTGSWHLHLWFLVSMLVYTLLVPALDGLARRFAIAADRALGTVPSFAAGFLVAGGIVGSVVVLKLLYSFQKNHLLDSWLVSVTLAYLPWFAAGVFAFHCKSVWDQLHRPSLIFIAIAVLCWLVIWQMPHSTQRYALAREVTIGALIPLMLWGARAFFSAQNAIFAYLSAHIYRLYLLHYFFIYVAAALLPRSVLEADLTGGTGIFVFLFILMFAVCASLATSSLIERSNRYVRFAFSGR